MLDYVLSLYILPFSLIVTYVTIEKQKKIENKLHFHHMNIQNNFYSFLALIQYMYFLYIGCHGVNTILFRFFFPT